MSETNNIVETSSIKVESSQSRPGTISWAAAVITLIVTLSILAGGGYALGKYKFWKTFDTTPLADRQESTYLQKAQADPENPENYVELGYVYFQKKQYDKAVSYYEKAISLDAKNYRAHYNLGLTYVALGKQDRAVEQYKQAIEIAPNTQGAHLSLGTLYVSMNKFTEAKPELDKAYQADPGNVELLYNIGYVYEKLGDKDGAIGIYKQVLSFGADNQNAKDALARLTGTK